MKNKIKKLKICLRDSPDLQEYPIFVGCLLSLESGGLESEIGRLKRSAAFATKVREQLQTFNQGQSHTIDDISKYFAKPIGTFTGIRNKRGQVSGRVLRYPATFQSAILFELSEDENTKKSAFLISTSDLPILRNCFGSFVNVPNFSDALCFFGQKSNQILTMENIR